MLFELFAAVSRMLLSLTGLTLIVLAFRPLRQMKRSHEERWRWIRLGGAIERLWRYGTGEHPPATAVAVRLTRESELEFEADQAKKRWWRLWTFGMLCIVASIIWQVCHHCGITP